jgi:hypothetical protein
MTHKKSTNRFYPIPGYKGYFINKTTTDVLCTNEPLPVILDQTPNSAKDPYYVVQLSDGKNHFIHRLMAKTFLPGPEKPHVNHIDGNKQNNSIDNLEWATPQENSQHAVDTGLIDTSIHFKEVHQYSLAGDYIATFVSDASAEAATGIAKQNISKCTLGKRPNAGGYQWRRVKLPKITPTDCKVLKGANVTNVDTEETSFIPIKGQDFYGPVVEFTGVKKHTLQRKFDKDVAFIDNFRVEKVYFT